MVSRTGMQRSNFDQRASDEITLLTGGIYGHSRVHKFGSSGTVSSSTVYRHIAQGGLYPALSGADVVTAVSIGTGAANDTAAGLGAQQITVNGLDENWEEKTETIEMNGTSETAATTTKFIRLFRAWVSRSGTYGDIDNSFYSHYGEIVISNPGVELLRISVDSGTFPAGQSECSAYTIPVNKVGILLGYSIWMEASKPVDFLCYARMNADDAGAGPYSGAIRTVSKQVGVQIPDHNYPPYPLGIFPGKTDIGMIARGAQTPIVSCDFQLRLIDIPAE